MKLSTLAVPFLVAIPLAVVACSAQRAAKDEAAVKAALSRADVVCVALTKSFPSPAIAKACGIEEPTAIVIRDGLAAYEDVQAGVSAGPDVSAAVAAAQAVGAAITSAPPPADAGGQ